MSKKNIIWFFLFTSVASFAQSKLSQSNIDTLILFYKNKLSQLIKDKELDNQLAITTEGISLFSSVENKKNNQPECTIYWNELNRFQEYIQFNPPYAYRIYQKKGKSSLHDSCTVPQPCGIINPPMIATSIEKPLTGYKIALDPGHIAGNIEMARLEGKFIEMTIDKQNIQLIEGELTLATAYFIKKILEEKGAEVFLTRSKPNETAFQLTFDEWIKTKMKEQLKQEVKNKKLSIEKAKELQTKASRQELFHRYFKNAELLERARRINAFKPDITLVIHYNVDEKNTNWTTPIAENYVMAFIGGAFTKGELRQPEDRFQLLRLLLSNELEESKLLSKTLLLQFEKSLHVSRFNKQSTLSYIDDFSIPTSTAGLYHRNLSLTRYINGIICYGETLYMDNEDECKRLVQKDTSYIWGKTSSRVYEVAQAYVDGLLNYITSLKSK